MTHQLFINEEHKELLWNRGTVNLTDKSEGLSMNLKQKENKLMKGVSGSLKD